MDAIGGSVWPFSQFRTVQALTPSRSATFCWVRSSSSRRFSKCSPKVWGSKSFSFLEASFRAQVLEMLVAEGAIPETLAAMLRGWWHSGFSVHNDVRIRGYDGAGRTKLAQYMLRAPLPLEKMTYDTRSGIVIYRSRMHSGLKRNFQLMPGAEWLALLCRHIPDRFEHLVRYVGWYSNRVRARRAAATAVGQVMQHPEYPRNRHARQSVVGVADQEGL